MKPYRRFLMGMIVVALLLSACRIVIDTKINPDGSGDLRNAVVYSAEERQNFEQTPGNESASICDSLRSSVPAEATLTEERHEGEAHCVTTRSFADLQELRQLYGQLEKVTVRRLEFSLGRLTFDIDVDLTGDGEQQAVAQEWHVTLPGTIETHNADRVDGQTLIWTISPGQQTSLYAESQTGLGLKTLGVTGLVLLAGAGGLVIALGMGALYGSHRRRRAGMRARIHLDMGATDTVKSTPLKQFLAFVAIGSFFATVEEFLTVVVLRRDIPGYLFTLVVLFPLFLAFVWWSSPVISRFIHQEPARDIAHFFAYGAIGLLIEWFVIGLSPWSNPDANPWAMLAFQVGMFSFWATVAFAPRLLTDPGSTGRNTGKAILKFFVPYFVVVYAISFLVPEDLKFLTVIALIIIGYTALNLLYLRYFMRLSSSRTADAAGEQYPAPSGST